MPKNHRWDLIGREIRDDTKIFGLSSLEGWTCLYLKCGRPEAGPEWGQAVGSSGHGGCVGRAALVPVVALLTDVQERWHQVVRVSFSWTHGGRLKNAQFFSCHFRLHSPLTVTVFMVICHKRWGGFL